MTQGMNSGGGSDSGTVFTVSPRYAPANTVPFADGGGRYTWQPVSATVIFGDGVTDLYALSHNLGEQYVNAFVVTIATGLIDTTPTIKFLNSNQVTVDYGSSPPATNSKILVVNGGPAYVPSVALNPGTAGSVTTGNTTIVAANPSRHWLAIYNFDPVNIPYLSLGGVPVVGRGASINPNGGVFICPPYAGTINAIASVALTVGIVEI